MTQDSFIDVSDVQNRGVIKKIIREGVGDTPCDGDKVFVHYVGTLQDGTKFDSSIERKAPFEFTIGKGQVIKGWDQGVKSMKKGELAMLTCTPEYAYGDNGSPPSIPPKATLNFEVELLDFQPEDISTDKDGGILRSIIKKGEGYDNPNDGALVKVHIEGKHDGKVFEDKDLELTLDQSGAIIEGLEHGIKKMKKGEISRFIIGPLHAYGHKGDPDLGIPANATLTYQVHLKDFEKAKESWELDLPEKLEQSAILKEKGTKCFKEGKYRKAIAAYKRIIDYLQYEPDAKDETLDQLNKLKLAANLNLCLCYLKLGEHAKCLEYSTKVIEQDPNSEKAYFRMGTALLAQKNFDGAIHAFQKVIELDPNNKAAMAELKIAQQLRRQVITKEKQLYANIFDKMAKMPPLESKYTPKHNFPGAQNYHDFGAGDVMESDDEEEPGANDEFESDPDQDTTKNNTGKKAALDTNPNQIADNTEAMIA